MAATRDVQAEQKDDFEDVHATPFVEDEDDDDDEGLDAEAEIELGFVSSVEEGEEHLSGAYVDWDGGKVGGQPIWLDPNVNIEAPCVCGVNMSFLLQIYCPLDTLPQAFHRSLYVFCCRTRGCSKIGHARVFRVQLPQKNAFYSDKEDDPTRKQSAGLQTTKHCAVCGLKGKFSCSACNMAQYCCKEHQKDHWKHGHKQDCPASAQQQKLIVSNTETIRQNGTSFVFPEYSIHIEHEPDRSIAQNESEARMMQAFEQASLNRTEGNDVFTDDSEIDLSQKDIAKMLGTQAQDKTYVGFLTRVALAKDQVLRYSRWDDEETVLWVHSQDKPTAIPCCSICHEPRMFEFQIMPQLLYHLKLSTELTTLTDQEVDWGTLVVYTCPQSCSAKQTDVDIVEEFIGRTHRLSRLVISLLAMSSIRVRATNKLLSKLGATKPSKNIQFELAHSGFDQLQSGVLNLDNALHGFILSLKAFHASSNVLLRAVEDVVNIRCSDNPSDSPEVKQFIDVFKACSLNIDITKFTEMTKVFETRVEKPSQGWLRQVEKLKTEIEHFNESHITYDHYTKKVQTLREAHNKRAGAGKQEKSKDVDKLVRNEQKLVAITNEYNKASEQTIENLRGFLKSRDSTLLPLVQRIIEFRVTYAKEVFDLTSKMEPLLKISSYDENLERLESLAPNGHDVEGSTTSPKKVVETPEPNVQTLSFNDFVGTSQPSTTPAPPPQDLLQTSHAENPQPTPSNSWSDFNTNAQTSFSSNASTSFTSFGEQGVHGSNHIVTSHVGGNFGSSGSNTVILTQQQVDTTKDFYFAPAPPAASEFNPFSSAPPAPFGDPNAFTPPPPPPPANTVPHQQSGGFDTFDFMGHQ